MKHNTFLTMVFTFSGDRIGAAIRKTQRKMRMQSGYKWSKENTELRNNALSASILKQTNFSTTSAAAGIGRRRSASAALDFDDDDDGHWIATK